VSHALPVRAGLASPLCARKASRVLLPVALRSRRVVSGWLVAGSLLVGCSGEVGAPLSPNSQLADNRAPSAPGSSSALPGVGAGPSATKPDGTPSVSTQPLDCKKVNVGATPLQRLARGHYVNSIRDLLKVTVAKDSLPEDEKVGAFDGNTVAPVTDLLVEGYMSAAESAAKAALPQIEKLVVCDRTKLGDAACAAQFIEQFGQRVYRRPLKSEERASYVAQFDAYKGKGYPAALRVIVQTMLQSPNFLYRVELTPVQPGAEVTTLDAYELASRLSFFLVSTTPDTELLEAAKTGELLAADGLTKQVQRLIDDPRLSETIDSFHLQWLDIDKVDTLSRDPALFPMFTPEIGAAMRKETLRFVNYVLREDDGTLDTLFTATYSFPEGPLLDLYGLDAAAAKTGGPVELDPSQRAGLLTQPAFLASHSYYGQTSPVLRGKTVIRNVLCQTMPDPPPNVNTTPPASTPDATTREKLIEHTSNPSCAACHKRIDGIGLGFEEFDAIGRFRTKESGKPVDASGNLMGTEMANGAFNGVSELAQKLLTSPELPQCVTTQWVRFALGRMEADTDACTLDKLFKDFSASGHDIPALLQSIVLSDAFRSKRVATESAP